MKVTKETLPLFNEMYELKFSEDEMEKAFTVQEKMAKNLRKVEEPYINTCVSNINLVINNGLNEITHTMYLDRDWNGPLQVSSVSNTEQESENEALNKIETIYYFMFEPSYLISTETYGSSSSATIKVKNIDPKDFHILLKNLAHCSILDIAAMSEKEIKDFDEHKIYDDLSWFVEITSGPSVLNKIKNMKFGSSGNINSRKKLTSNTQELKEICSWLMPNSKISEIPEDSNIEELQKESCSRHNAIGYLHTIFEKDNYRLGFISIISSDYWDSKNFYRIVLLSHENELFNYADIGRFILFGKINSYRYDDDTPGISNFLGEVLFSEDIKLPASSVLEWIVKHNNDKITTLMSSAQLKFSVKKCSEEKRREEEEKEEKIALEEKLQLRIKELSKGKKILLNSMIINKNSIEYQKQKLILENSSDWVAELLSHLSRSYKFDLINWDSVFEEFISLISRKTSNGTIGDVKFNVVFNESVNKKNITCIKTYLNGKRINRNELQECLERAVCYTNQEDYDEFLFNVSQCSLKFHLYLQSGFNFTVRGIKHSEGFSFKLPLERKKNLMYVSLKEKEFKVRDTNRMIKMQELTDLGEIMELLLGTKVLEGMTINDAKSVLKLAKIEYQEAVTKSKALLKETEKTLKLVKRENIEMDAITVSEGYVVTGKLRQYVVANTNRCEVYEYPSGRYICIIDKSTAQAGKDKLINRLYALSNDQALAQDIHTLN